MTKKLKSKIEAVLFCNPDGIKTRKLAKLCGIGSVGHVKSTLEEMKKDLEKKHRGICLLERKGTWYFRPKDEHTNLVKGAARPEMSKAVLETLALIAHRKKAKQSEIVKIRTNKAYNHIKELEEKEFITSNRKGHTSVLKPTKKFYTYFNLEQGEKLMKE